MSVQELLVTDHYSVGISDEKCFERFGTLKLPHLSMLSFKERIPSVKRTYFDLDDDSDTEEAPADSSIARRLIDRIPIWLQSRGAVKVPTLPTILNRLRDGGVGLKRLALCLDFDSQWVNLTFDL